MSHRLHRRALMTAAGLTTLLIASAAQAQTLPRYYGHCSDYRYYEQRDSVYLDRDCNPNVGPEMRKGNEDAATTGSLGNPGRSGA